MDKLQKCLVGEVEIGSDFLRSTFDLMSTPPRPHREPLFMARPWATFAQVIRTLGVSPKGAHVGKGAEKLRKR